MVTRTINQLHFEDLDPIRFEELILSMVYRMKKWYQLYHFGKKGSDGGIDIVAIELVNDSEIKYVFQCKRYIKITNSILKKIVDDYLLKNREVPDFYILVVSCSLSRNQIEYFEKYCKEKNFKKVIIWAKSLLEVKLNDDYPDLLYKYFGIDNSIQKQKRDEIVNDYIINNSYSEELIKQVTCTQNKKLLQQVPLKDCYIDIYLTKASDNGKRLLYPSVLAEMVLSEFVQSNEDNVIMILGEPGQGKSTLCLWTYYQESDLNRFGMPVYVFRLNNAVSKICNENSSYLPIIENVIYNSGIIEYKKYDDLYSRNTRMKILKDKCGFLKNSLIFLDGYDELCSHFPSDYTISDFFEDIYEMVELLSCKIIVTSRITCFTSLKKLILEVDSVFYIDYLHKDQQIKWIQKSYGKQNKIIYNEEMLNIIHEDPDYKNLCELLDITYLFQMIVKCNVFIDKNCNRANLYKILTTNIIHKSYEQNRKVKRGIERKIEDENVEKIFSELAYEIWCENDEYIIKGEKDYENAMLQYGIIFFFKTKNLPDKKYHIQFLHRSFYQFYLALFIKKEFENAIKQKNLKFFLKKISFRKLEFDIISLLKDLRELIIIDVNNIINLVYETECILEDNNVLFPIKKANNIFLNIISILNIYDVKWGQFLSSKLKNVMRYFNCCGINLSYADLKEIDLSCCNFIGANFYHTNFSGSNIRGTSFRGANLQWANFTNAILSGADLRGADMRNADLRGTNLRGADLRGADLRGVKKDSKTNLYGITTTQLPEGVFRQMTKTIYDNIKEFGYDIEGGLNIIDN